MSGYSVLRARREFANQSNVGFMLTSTNRQLVDEVSFLPTTANTGGIDYDWRIGRRFNISGYWAGSRVQGTTQAITRLQENTVHQFQRTDADHVEVDPLATVLSGHSGSISVGKIGGEKTRFSSYLGYKSPGFDMNDLGFQRRADERSISNWFQWRDNTPGRFTRSFVFNLNQWAGWNFNRERTFSGGNVNMHWTWKNYYTSGFGVNYNATPLRDRVTRGGPAVLGNRHAQRVVLQRHRRTKSAVVQLQRVSRDRRPRNDTPQHRSLRQLAADFAVSVSSGFRYNINNDDAQWVENVDARRRHPLRVRPLEATHVGVYLPRQLHAHADAVDSDLRGAVRVGRRVHELPRARRPAGGRVQRAL